jgi:hypothetical protein
VIGSSAAHGSRLAVVPRRGDRLGIEIISADGAERLARLEAVDVRGAPAWSPDGAWLVTGGVDTEGQGLFKIPVGGGAPQVLVRGEASQIALGPTFRPGPPHSADEDLTLRRSRLPMEVVDF